MKLPHLTTRERVELKRDLLVFAGAFLSTGVLDGGHLTVAALTAAVVTALKVTARALFPHEDPQA
jgi:hypothetical protein